MREYHFNPTLKTPLVRALLTGPRCTKHVRLVFDTGAAMTQFHQATMNFVGYNESLKIADAVVTSTTTDEEIGYVVEAQRLYVLGTRFDNIPIAGYDMSRLSDMGIDGLLGWDVIRTLHLEMVGPSGLLKVF